MTRSPIRRRARTFREASSAVSCAALLALFAPRVAAGAEPSTWQPGEPSTASVRGEIGERDEPGGSDGVYGRFGGDLFLALGAGAAFGDGTRGALLGRALYYHSAALVVAYEDALGGATPPARLLSFAFELRPLFLPRWALDAQIGSALADLTLDSLTLGAGLVLSDPGGGAARSGFELSLGLGVPLQADARGFWLEARGALRPDLDRAELEAVLLLSFYGALLTPIVR